MSDLLRTVKDSFQHAIDATKEVSTRAPGNPISQALVVGALVGVVAHHLMKKHYHLPPGPRPLPLLGSLLSMNSKEEQFYVTVDRWAKENYGPVMSVYFGPMLCVFLNDLHTINEAFVQRGDDFAGRAFLHSLDTISEGSKDIGFADYSSIWKLQRKITMKAMRHFMMGSHLEKVAHEVVRKVLNKMAMEPGPFDPDPYNATLMFHIIEYICFGDTKPYDSPSTEGIPEMFELLNNELGNGFLEDVIPLLKYWPTRKFRSFVAMFYQLLDYIEKNIQIHRQKFSPSARDFTDSILLAQMQGAQEESAEVMAMFTDVHVRQTVSDIFIAGVDTSRLVLDWAMLFMAGNPEIQKQAQAEIDAVTGTDMPGLGHRSKLQYTQAVLYEIIRMGSVVPISLPHKTLCNTTVGGYDVPKDTMVLANLWAVLYDPDLWDHPDEFRPERFLDDQGNLKRTPKGFLAFSVGRRVCIGEGVSKVGLFLLLASLLKRFTISLPDGVAYNIAPQVTSMTIHVPKPFKIVVTQR